MQKHERYILLFKWNNIDRKNKSFTKFQMIEFQRSIHHFKRNSFVQTDHFIFSQFFTTLHQKSILKNFYTLNHNQPAVIKLYHHLEKRLLYLKSNNPLPFPKDVKRFLAHFTPEYKISHRPFHVHTSVEIHLIAC